MLRYFFVFPWYSCEEWCIWRAASIVRVTSFLCMLRFCNLEVAIILFAKFVCVYYLLFIAYFSRVGDCSNWNEVGTFYFILWFYYSLLFCRFLWDQALLTRTHESLTTAAKPSMAVLACSSPSPLFQGSWWKTIFLGWFGWLAFLQLTPGICKKVHDRIGT